MPLEALLAALYLDAGIDTVRAFVLRRIVEPVTPQLTAAADHGPMVDFKSALQELAQARRLPQPRYMIVRERGPEHSKVFTVEVRVGHEHISQGEGFTKKSAAQKAAREIYHQLLREAGTAPEAV